MSAGVNIDVRRSVDEGGRTGQHAVARVRNLTPRESALTVELAAAELPDSEMKGRSDSTRSSVAPDRVQQSIRFIRSMRRIQTPFV
jgi:hypothetical protein